MTIPVDPLAPSVSRARALSLRIRPSMLPGIALVAILLIGLASSLYTLVVKHGDISPKDVTWSRLANGKLFHAVSGLLQDKSPLSEPLVTVDRVTSYMVTGDLGKQVRRGCGDWLFLTDELTLYPDRLANAVSREKLVEQVAGYLKARGVALTVAVVPDKSRIESAELCRVGRPAAIAGRLDSFEEHLKAAGIGVIDLLGPMRAAGGELYYRTDTHWNQHGARTAAEAAAAALRGAGLAPRQKADFQVTEQPSGERIGDLIRLAGLDHVSYPFRPHGDVVTEKIIAQSAAEGVGLLDETPAPELALVGTSFSNTADFSGFLALALGSPLENKAVTGGGVINSARSYFATPEFQKTPPRAIVWEIPERMLEEPIAASDKQWAETLAPNNPVK